MIYLLAETLVFIAVIVWLVRTHNDQIQSLLDRIQAPETVAGKTLSAEDYEPVVLPHTEDSYWENVQKDFPAPELSEVE